MRSLARRLEAVEQAAGLRGPGCAVCRGWGDVQLVSELDRRPADAGGAAGGRCPGCGRRPRLVRHYAGLDVGEV